MNERLRDIKYEEDEGKWEDGGVVVDTETGMERLTKANRILRKGIFFVLIIIKTSKYTVYLFGCTADSIHSDAGWLVAG